MHADLLIMRDRRISILQPYYQKLAELSLGTLILVDIVTGHKRCSIRYFVESICFTWRKERRTARDASIILKYPRS